MDSEVGEDKDSGPEVQLAFPSSVLSRIEELMGGTDQFDSDDFDAVAYINKVFPTEQSLAGVECAAARCQYRLASARSDSRRLVRAHAAQRAHGHEALQQAQQCIAELALQVADINKKAERSESMVREITAEIKQLDCAKWNLTAAITALNHLHMLAGGAKQLQALTAGRRYRDLTLPLQAIMEVLQHLECYQDIPELAALRDQVAGVRKQLAEQILADVQDAFSGSKSTVPLRVVSEAMGAADGLGVTVRGELVRWLVDKHLNEYMHLFAPEEECAWISHIDQRFSWVKKRLLSLEESLGGVVPPHWKLSEALAARFCSTTRAQLTDLLQNRRSELDVKLLLHGIQRTRAFELLLHKRFVGTDYTTDAALEPNDTNKQSEAEPASPGDQADPSDPLVSPPPQWVGSIGGCFEPYLSLYITSLDANLRTLLDTFIQDAKTSEGASVVGSCGDLFLFYKKCLVQCAALSTGEPMIELCMVFAKYLREYATAVLAASLPRGAGGALLALHSLLRDDATAHRYTPAEVGRTARVVTTAEYCLETTAHLELKLREKTAPNLRARIDLAAEQDAFHKVVTEGIDLLVEDLSLGTAPALASLSRTVWAGPKTVGGASGANGAGGTGDASPYVGQLAAHFRAAVPALRDHFAASRKYFTQLCIRFASAFIPKFTQALYRCRPLSAAGAEQLLLDTHTLKTILLDLPSIGSEVKRPAPTTYTKVVIKLMTKAEMVLKMVMAPLESGGVGSGGVGGLDGFVSRFVQLLPECSLQEFHKVLDMKGVKLSKTQLMAVDILFKETTRNVNNDTTS